MFFTCRPNNNNTFMSRLYFEESEVRDVPYTYSFCIVVDGDRHESSLEDRTSECSWLQCYFKQILVNSLKWLLHQIYSD